ncbi:MAG: EVE domain-containing protein [Planctomycetia bacterium]|nr:MAG: EVE domain-containing protein [Planctomycetia bacterium]
MPAYWLIKGDPDDYSAGDLERDGVTAWEGVRNAAAQLHLRAMSRGDGLLIYHTGNEKSVVARGTIASAPRPDPGDPDGRRVVVDVRFDSWLPRPVTLAEIKADPAFAEFALVRIGRLSVMPVAGSLWKRLLALGGAKADSHARSGGPRGERPRQKL